MAKRKREVEHEATANGSEDAKSTTKSTKRSKNVVDQTNALDPVSFVNRYFDQARRQYSHGSNHSHTSLTFADDLSPSQLDQCFDLIASTSRKDYEPSSFGWHPKRKKREMKEKEMRYLQVHTRSGEAQKAEYQGFLSFMITHDSSPVVPVLYIYEIHLTEAARGIGLGHFLIQTAESIAEKVGVRKVMLTCFLSNTKARTFYDRLGYKTDACSPEDRKTRKKVVKVDYVIMSKDVSTQNSAEAEHDSGLEVSQFDSDSLDEDDANEYPSLEESPKYLQAWTEKQKHRELLTFAISAAGRAKADISNGENNPSSRNRTLLDNYFDRLHERFEAARNFEEEAREQMYHVKSLITDVNKTSESLEASRTTCIKQEPSSSSSPISTLEDQDFDMEKATEQVYSAFYTMARKAEEIDDRLDNIAEREQEADALEQDLDDRGEELDDWEDDLQARESALAEREQRLGRARQRLQRRRSGQNRIQRAVSAPRDEDSCEGERARALPSHQESPPRDLVYSWLMQNASAGQTVAQEGRPPWTTFEVS